MNERILSRMGCIILSLFPALWGAFGFWNNMADFEGTARNAVAPLLSMKDTYQNPFLMWRSINTDWAALFGLAVITGLEAIAGTLATIGVIIMTVKLKSPYSDFQRG
ncbi:TPA: DUF2165 family protein [Enterobacter asburiae]